jgi:hypothetical protein
MTSQERQRLLKRGKQLLHKILKQLNALDARPVDEYRRESDLEEICIALALQDEAKPNGE